MWTCYPSGEAHPAEDPAPSPATENVCDSAASPPALDQRRDESPVHRTIAHLRWLSQLATTPPSESPKG